MAPLPVIAFISEGATDEETIGGTNEAAIVTIIAPRNPRSYFFISCFTVSITPSDLISMVALRI